jgi:hypothetical protein
VTPFIILSIIFLETHLFDLAPWAHVSGTFNTADLGLVSMLISICILLVRKKDISVLANSITIFIFVLFILVFMHIGIAMIYHNQSFIQGLIGGRKFFHFISFFLFLLLLDSEEKILKVLDLFSYVALIIVALSLINYFGPTIFHHKHAEGHGVRAGVTRGYIPSMTFISFCALWSFNKLISNRDRNYFAYFTVFILYGAHVFRQSRGSLITLSIVTIVLLVSRRKYGLMMAGAFLIIFSSVALSYFLEENLITNPFVSAKEDILESEGSWEKRLRQIKVDLEEFKKHYIIGGGAGVLRSQTDAGNAMRSKTAIEMLNLSYQHDLGYTHWLKNFGSFGLFMLIFYFSTMFIMNYRSFRLSIGYDYKILLYFTLSYLLFIIISFITLNHFGVAKHSIFNSLNAALIVRCYNYLTIAKEREYRQ